MKKKYDTVDMVFMNVFTLTMAIMYILISNY